MHVLREAVILALGHLACGRPQWRSSSRKGAFLGLESQPSRGDHGSRGHGAEELGELLRETCYCGLYGRVLLRRVLVDYILILRRLNLALRQGAVFCEKKTAYKVVIITCGKVRAHTYDLRDLHIDD